MMLAAMLATIAANGALILQPGDTVLFHLDHERPILDRVVLPTEKIPAGSLLARLTIDSSKGKPETLLGIVNNTPVFLSYKAWISKGGTTQPTSVCTVMSRGRSSFEMWPYSVDAVALDMFTAAPEQVNCE